jgi:hypothetical protein
MTPAAPPPARFHQVVTRARPQVAARLKADDTLQDNLARRAPDFITRGRRDVTSAST